MLLFSVTSLLMIVYLLWRSFFTLPLGESALEMIFGILLLLAEMASILTTLELYDQKLRSRKFELKFPEIDKEDYPHVDVLIATHNESCELLYKTANACTYLEYPDRSKVHIYLCDDGARREVEMLAESLGIGYLGLSGNQNAKSGNLNHALLKTHSPLIATFDADMIPRRNFLMKTVPYFLLPFYMEENGKWRKRLPNEPAEASRIGLIQTPQSFYNPDLFQYHLYAEQIIPNEQDFFSREVNVMRNAVNAVAYTGSNAVLARQALETIGGFPVKTITEDFETSVRMQKAGYRTYATREVLSSGLSAASISDMLRQRKRWARGVLQSLQNTRAIVSGKLPLRTRLTYLSIGLYWWSFFHRLIFLLAPILFGLFDLHIVDAKPWEIFAFWLPAYVCGKIAAKRLSGNLRTQRWSQIFDTILAPFLIVPVLLETLHIHQREFQVTEKKKTDRHRRERRYVLFPACFLLLTAAALLRCIRETLLHRSLPGVIVGFWLLHHMVPLSYAVLFMMGRKSPRQSERNRADAKLWIVHGETVLEAVTYDVSDTGLSFFLQEPVLKEKECVQLHISDGPYRAGLKGQVVYLQECAEGWKCALTVQPETAESRSQYMQIIYDRPHSLPVELQGHSTVLRELRRNLAARISQ